MTPQQATETNTLIDTLKQQYDEFRDITDPILRKQKLEFDLFYNDDLKYRKICLEIEEQAKTQNENLSKSDFRQYMTESKEIYSAIKKSIEERERFNINLHRKERVNQINTFTTWINLFIGEKASIQQSATIFKLNKDLLKSKAVSLKSDILMDSKKLLKDLSEEEEIAFNFNMARPFREYWNKQEIEILKPFKSKFKGIPIDLELMNTLQKRKPLTTKKSKLDTGFNLGYSDEQLIALHKALIDAMFLHDNTDIRHFKNAFNGEKLAEDFEPLKWTEPTMGAVFFFHIKKTKNPQWTKYSYLFEPATYKKLLSQSRGNGTFERHLDTLKKINL